MTEYSIPKEKMIARLNKIFYNCSKANWDTYCALPISIEAYNESKRFIELLQDIPDVKAPFIAPEPNGGICFEWENEKQDMALIMSIDKIGEINYGVCYEGIVVEANDDDVTVDFKDLIPEEILEILGEFRWFDDKDKKEISE